MAIRCNLACLSCQDAHNALNGRYCRILCRYVEHASQPPCKPRPE